MNLDDVRKNAEVTIAKAERIEALTKYEGWKDLMSMLDVLIYQEVRALAGQKLDSDYYKKIGFLQATFFIKEIQSIIANKTSREYLLHQGRAKSFEFFKGLPKFFQAQKRTAIDQLEKIINGGIDTEKIKQQFIENTYKSA